MKRFLLAVIIPALASCNQNSVQSTNTPIVEVVSGVELINYDSPKGTYSCRAPADWKGDELPERYGTDTVSFIGPLNGPRPVSVFINVMKYPMKNEPVTDPEAYAKSFELVDFKDTKYEKRDIEGRQVIFFNRERPFRKLHSTKVEYMERQDIALIPVKGGFFRIDHTAPKDAYQQTLPVFEAVVRSFKPKES